MLIHTCSLSEITYLKYDLRTHFFLDFLLCMQKCINAFDLEYCLCIKNIVIVGKMTCRFFKNGIHLMNPDIFLDYVFCVSDGTESPQENKESKDSNKLYR